ncbi:MAG: protein-L-isoaspartate(D-aspartate) O-methyltransferase [Chloroflexi bacterium]|nr:protein-L-isoaspartate(D-aspartate) O-methyltransferase [Chloroflexota bacterium]
MNRTTSESLERARASLLTELAHGIVDQRVLDAMGGVPREEFVPAEASSVAYQNRPLPIGHGQTISQPLMVALMTQALMLTGDERVLEVGTGSGYQAALISLLAARVVSVERVPELAASAAERLGRLGYSNVEVHSVTDELGWPEGAPYAGIIVTAASPDVPRPLLDQLAMNGRLVLPVGSREIQELVQIIKTPEGAQRHNLGSCRFVPLLGRGAWTETR